MWGECNLTRLPDIWPDDDKRVAGLMMAYWANFAKTGYNTRKHYDGLLSNFPKTGYSTRIHYDGLLG